MAENSTEASSPEEALSAKIDAANKVVLGRMFEAEPVLVDVQPAGAFIEGLRRNLILHAGPPIEWERMCGPMRGAICGIAVFEGWANDLAAAERAAASGKFSFAPNHHYGAVGPMTGMITPSQPVFIVENRKFGNRACCTINEGLGKVMRFGGNDAEVLNRLRWIADVLGPALSASLQEKGGLPLKGIIARGLAMGDEMHQRNLACSALFLREMAPSLARTTRDTHRLAEVLDFIGRNDQFFLNIAMAMGKAIMDPARNVAASTIVTAMCRNGTDFGVRVSTTGDRWFTAPVGVPQGLYFPGYSEQDANPDMGDSAILETIGLGDLPWPPQPPSPGLSVRDPLAKPRPSPARCTKSPSAEIPSGRFRTLTTRESRRASTFAKSSAPARLRSSIPGSPIKRPASARSARELRARPSVALKKRSPPPHNLWVSNDQQWSLESHMTDTVPNRAAHTHLHSPSGLQVSNIHRGDQLEEPSPPPKERRARGEGRVRWGFWLNTRIGQHQKWGPASPLPSTTVPRSFYLSENRRDA